MSDFRDRFEAQLESAAELLAVDALQPTPSRRPHRNRTRRRQRVAIAAALAAMLLLAAVALAATGTIRLGPSPEAAEGLVAQVLASTEHADACRLGSPATGESDQAPLPQITALLPETALSANPSPALVAVADAVAHAPVLDRTIREVAFPGGIRLVVFVSQGVGPFTVAQPQACLSARLAALAALRPSPQDPVGDAAAGLLRRIPDTSPGVQSLTVEALRRGPGAIRADAAASYVVTPASPPLRHGLALSSSGCEAQPTCTSLYAGIAAPGAERIVVGPEHPARQPHGALRRAPVEDGLYAVALPRGTGPEQIVAVSRAGAALQTTRIRQG